MRVLSRRRKFAKGRGVRVFWGCGFCRSNGTPLAPSPRSSPWRRIHLSDGVRGPSLGVCSGVPGAAPSTVVSNKQQRPSALRRCSGGGDSSTASASCIRGAEAAAWPRAAGTQLGPFTSHPQQQQRQARRRRRAATTPLDGVGERSPARRRLLPPCGFSHRARGNGALLWRTRDGTSTAARLRRRLLT